MKIPYYEIHSFTEKPGGGNPAGVCPLAAWIPEGEMQKIATEKNLSETAFFVPENDGFGLRWFAPAGEIDLCGHATLATAFVLFEERGFQGSSIHFRTKSGTLNVARRGREFVMDFPLVTCEPVEPPQALLTGLGCAPLETYAGMDYVAVLESEQDVRAVRPVLAELRKLDRRGVVVTARGRITDYVCRCFAPKFGIAEDPVTGSIQSFLAPYWSRKLDRNPLSVAQLSERGGQMKCELKNDRVFIAGTATLYRKESLVIKE